MIETILGIMLGLIAGVLTPWVLCGIGIIVWKHRRDIWRTICYRDLLEDINSHPSDHRYSPSAKLKQREAGDP